MNKYIAQLVVASIFFSACSKEEVPEIQQISQEIISIHDFKNEEAAEILRHNVLEEYGGVFKLLKLYHKRSIVDEILCDTTLSVVFLDNQPDKYTLSSELDINTTCGSGWGVYNNRFYRGFHTNSVQTTTSNIFDLEMRIEDNQTIAGNFEDNVYTYHHFVIRRILITEGMSAELDPTARLEMFFPSCNYDIENIELTSVSVPTFELEIRTNEGDPIPYSTKQFGGTIELINNTWTVMFDDGTSIAL